MASRLRSLIIPSHGLNGLLMLCAKPGSSMSSLPDAAAAAAAAASNVVEARNLSARGSQGRREEGGLLSSQSAPRTATHGSPLSPGWRGQWRVSGIVTGAESTSRQFGFEALRPLQRRVQMQELHSPPSARVFDPRTHLWLARMCSSRIWRV